MARARVVTSAADLATAARLLHDFNTEYDEPTPAPAWLARRLTELVALDTSVLLSDDDAGLAVLRFRPSLWSGSLECYLAELYVVPDRRGQGIGTDLLQTCLDHARERGADYMDLCTTEDDVAARYLYEKLGFGRTEGRPDGPLAFYYEREL